MIPEIAKWAIIAMIAFGTIASVLEVGKPRQPTTGATAATVVVLHALIIAAILAWWQ